MKGEKLIRLTKWLAGVFALAWLLGALPLVPSPIDEAQAGFFDKVQSKGNSGQTQTQKASPKSPPTTYSPAKSSGSPKSLSLLKPVTKNPPPASPNARPTFVAPKPAAPNPAPTFTAPRPVAPAPAPAYVPPAANGGLFGAAKDSSRPQARPTPAPRQDPVPLPRQTARDGFFDQAPRANAGDGFVDRRPREIPGNVARPVMDAVKAPPKAGWTSGGYFERLRSEAWERYYRARRGDCYWYYPYDYEYYRWRRDHIMPVFVWVNGYGSGGYDYPYYAPTTVIVETPYDWVQGETYIPYLTWPAQDLMQTKSDIEEAWRHEQIELIERHLDLDHQIACYMRDEFTHNLTADEFRDLTLDAFSSIRTRNFDITSVRYVSTQEWARLKGKHIFYDPYGNRTTVYLSYLLRHVDDGYGRWRWVIWEVRQSPWPD